jgi:hypothetical protein
MSCCSPRVSPISGNLCRQEKNSCFISRHDVSRGRKRLRIRWACRACVRTPPTNSVPPATAENIPGRSSIGSTLFRMFFRQNSHEIVILSGAPHEFIASDSACGAESKDPGGPYLTYAARSFSTTEGQHRTDPSRDLQFSRRLWSPEVLLSRPLPRLSATPTDRWSANTIASP